MNLMEARDEYLQAFKLGQKAYKESGNQHPLVLDELLGESPINTVVDVGVIEIPIQRIVGVKSAGRISAFSADFLPLMQVDTEFSIKWMELCAAHLSDGIRDPILCYEYMGNFYVQEGNKRVSV